MASPAPRAGHTQHSGLRPSTVALWVLLPLIAIGAALFFGVSNEGAGSVPEEAERVAPPRSWNARVGTAAGARTADRDGLCDLELPADMTLPASWTVGELPRRSQCTYIVIPGTGWASIDGVRYHGAEFWRALGKFESSDSPERSTPHHLVLAAADSVPAVLPLRIITETHYWIAPDLVHFVVRHRGSGEIGQLAVDIGPFFGLRKTSHGEVYPRRFVRIGDAPEGVPPERLREPLVAHLRRPADPPEWLWIKPAERTSTAHFLATLDMLHRAGARRVMLGGGFPKAGDPFWSDSTAMHADPTESRVTIDGIQPISVAPQLVPIAPLSRGFAQFGAPPKWPYWWEDDWLERHGPKEPEDTR